MFRISTTILAAALALASTVSIASAQGQKAMECVKVDAKPADAGYQTVGIRRPKVEVEGQRITDMLLQIALPVGAARTDAASDDPKILEIADCSKNSAGFTTGMKVRVVNDGDWDETEIVLPETTKAGTKFQSCSAAAKTCFVGTFDAFDKGVTLQAGAATKGAATLKGGYKF
jgi:hypothetical protein